MKNDSSIDCRIQYNTTFDETLFFKLNETARHVVSNLLCGGNVGRDNLNSATAVGNGLTFLA